MGFEKWLILFTTISSGKDRGAGHVNQLKQYQKLVFIKRRFCYQFGGITKELSILKSYHPTINSVVYIEQLTKLNNAVEEKRPELTNQKDVVFHHDNARPHTYLVTRQKLLELGWDVLSYPPYSPDLAPSDYFLFQSLQNSLNGKNFNNDDDIKSYLIQFFAKNQKFYERGIMMLPERWQKVIDQNGQHITE
ncbi:Ammar1 transposase [Apis mellifera caucasica]|nr:Ammar1 transposase [Apis mellifera caucasica]